MAGESGFLLSIRHFPPMSTLPFSVVLMAGGRSRRMGRDKARLLHADGRELWRRQLSVLRELGAEECLISCRPDQTCFAGESGVRRIFDQWPDAGPMGGIVSCLEAAATRRLLVLGVDLPEMTTQGLMYLLDQCGPDEGAAFHTGRFFEPLAALYVREMVPEGRARLERGDFSLQPWLREGAGKGILKAVPPPAEFKGCFRNLNSPGDL